MEALTTTQTGKGVDLPVYNLFGGTKTNRRITLGGGAEDIAVPSGASIMRIYSTADIYAAADATAAIPTADTTSGSSVPFAVGIPELVFVQGLTNISVITGAATCDVSAIFFN